MLSSVTKPFPSVTLGAIFTHLWEHWGSLLFTPGCTLQSPHGQRVSPGCYRTSACYCLTMLYGWLESGTWTVIFFFRVYLTFKDLYCHQRSSRGKKNLSSISRESSLEKHLYRFFGHFFNWVVFLLLKVKVVQSDSFQPPGRYSPWNSPGQNAEVSSRSLLQGIFPNQGSNPGLPYCRPIPYQLSH